jgi:uncharacterized membrane protein YbhN (UPF0104 family)
VLLKSILARFKWISLINFALIFLVLYFVVVFLKTQWPQITATTVHFNSFFLGLTFLIFEIYWLLQILNWRHIMRQQGVNLPFLQASYFYFISCLLAYIPGKIGNVIGMASLAEKHQISKTKTVTTVFLIQIYALISGALVVCASQLFLLDKLRELFLPILPFMVTGILIGLIALSQKYIVYPHKIAEFFLKKQFDKPAVPYRYHLVNILFFSGCWFVLSLSLWCLLKSVDPSLSIRLYIDVMSIFLFSYLLGLLAITLPSGLGLVEITLSYGYNLIANPKIALIGAVGFRFLTLTTILGSLFFILLFKYIPKAFENEVL